MAVGAAWARGQSSLNLLLRIPNTLSFLWMDARSEVYRVRAPILRMLVVAGPGVRSAPSVGISGGTTPTLQSVACASGSD